MMIRSYQSVFQQHLKLYRQMIFLVGPRQVGKTTLCQQIDPHFHYFNWDDQDHRELILEGPRRISQEAALDQLREKPLLIVFDEIHKYNKWKDFLKGFFDVYGERSRVVVTGSSRLDIFKKGGDSLMGRYFLYRLHPVSVGEIIGSRTAEKEIHPPRPIDKNAFDQLLTFGGFPEPFLKANMRFFNRWKRLRRQQLLYEDIRDLTRIQELRQLEILTELIRRQSGQLLQYSNLANKVRVSVDTIRRWISTLEKMYFCFTIQPWSRNVARSLLKQPKIYCWDWSVLDDPGSRVENLVASHLLKAVYWWTDNGLGEYELYFLRDKDRREVDFLITRNQAPWFLVEVKINSSKTISRNLIHFIEQTRALHAFQVTLSLDYIDMDCFTTNRPVIVPLKTFLSQLV